MRRLRSSVSSCRLCRENTQDVHLAAVETADGSLFGLMFAAPSANVNVLFGNYATKIELINKSTELKAREAHR